ncbi:protein kinase [Roseisolibacter sp. H3M3-2]|uniref:protein kinase domain-containing protein n=1 Tax=Roseisolibacter sp. H3M3-2 TaxID=3031323 RepID=UPI0023DCAD61|nr:protein kinase [Roseisolibacter sp. H3M3-2]MDF1505029.1 protein kinase [Roseisolibacter sp. H3M3-2]
MGDHLRDRLQSSLGSAYTLERELGGGGMSRVFVAEDAALGRRVVVKVLAPELAEGLSAERFAREIRLAARLQHPNVVPVLAAGAGPDGLPYYAMPFVEGASLRERVAAGPLPVAEALAVLRDVARALAYAHGHGVVHRDVKPENVLLSGGAAVVADFGIAKAVRAAGGGATLTQVGMAVGTPAYMAPEQAAGDPGVDHRADLYAWGLLAWESLAGRHPFADRTTPMALIGAHLTQVPAPLGTARPDAPPALAALCLDKDPAARPADATEVIRALDAIALTPPSAPAAAARPDASVAVLPFANMSADADNAFFSDGVTEDLISALTQVPGLRVAARASAFALRGRDDDLRAIGERLGVRTVLQGSVRRAGNRVRVTAQLMSAEAGVQLWSERFDRDLDDVFAIQDEIARAIVERLELTLGLRAAAPLVAPPTEDLEAYHLYLRGREAVHQRIAAALRRGVDFFRQALARDPGYARAHAGIAEAYHGLGIYQYVPPLEARREAEAALAAAERADPALPSIPFLRAQRKLYLGPEWASAGADLREALRRAPHDGLSHAYAAVWHGLAGDADAVAAAVTRATELDPLSPFVHVIGGAACFVSDAHARGVELCERGLAMDPNSVVCLWGVSTALPHVGRLDEAVARAARAVELSQRGPLLVGVLAKLLARAGRRDEALALRDELETRAAQQYVAPVSRLTAELGLGDEARIADAVLANVAAESSPMTLLLSAKPELDALVDHPRLGALVRRLSPYAGGLAR